MMRRSCLSLVYRCRGNEAAPLRPPPPTKATGLPFGHSRSIFTLPCALEESSDVCGLSGASVPSVSQPVEFPCVRSIRTASSISKILVISSTGIRASQFLLRSSFSVQFYCWICHGSIFLLNSFPWFNFYRFDISVEPF